MIPFRWTIKRKLIALGAGTVLPLVVVLALWIQWETGEVEKATQAHLNLVSRQAADQAEVFVESVRGLVVTLSTLPQVRNLEAVPAQDLLLRVKGGFPQLANLFIYTADGRLIASAVAPPGGRAPSATDLPWARQALEIGRPVVSDFLIGFAVGEPVIHVAAAVRAGGEAPRAVVAAAVSLRRLNDRLRGLPLTPGWATLLVDGEGKVSASGPNAERPARNAEAGGWSWRWLQGAPPPVPGSRAWTGSPS